MARLYNHGASVLAPDRGWISIWRTEILNPEPPMAIYVDKEENPFGRMKMCHMLGDTVAELHEFAVSIGLKREWFQPRSRPHYDLSKSRRSVALAAGAIEVDRRELVAMMKRQMPVWTAEYAAARAAGKEHP